MTSDVIIDETAFVDKSSKIYGKVRVGNQSSIWPNVVIRSEMHEVVIGSNTNIQDFSMIHVGTNTGTYIGNFCSITHHCTLHGCTVEDNCLIGINSTIMDGAKIGKNSIVAGGSFVKEGMEVEHARFGRGKVEKIEGKGIDKKAIINFNMHGPKNLLLRFAKLKVL